MSKEKSPRPEAAGTGAKETKLHKYNTEIANDILWQLEERITKAFCSNCDAAYVERGARSGGLQITPDEITCPVDFAIGEEGCIKAPMWEELNAIAYEMAQLLTEEER